MKRYIAKPLVVLAVKFDGTNEMALKLKDLFPFEKLEIRYDYGKARFKVMVLNSKNNRYYDIEAGDYVMTGTLGDLLVFRENLFEAMYSPVEEEDAD